MCCCLYNPSPFAAVSPSTAWWVYLHIVASWNRWSWVITIITSILTGQCGRLESRQGPSIHPAKWQIRINVSQKSADTRFYNEQDNITQKNITQIQTSTRIRSTCSNLTNNLTISNSSLLHSSLRSSLPSLSVSKPLSDASHRMFGVPTSTFRDGSGAQDQCCAPLVQ